MKKRAELPAGSALIPQTARYTDEHRRRRFRNTVVGILACTVALGTVLALMLPAVTLEQTAHCGLEEHKHGPECLEEVLICGFEETGETETDAGSSAGSGHIHSDSCYEETQVLICGQEENAGHVHDDSCILYEQSLICADTSEEHEHTEACYETTETFICGLSEGEGSHTHGPECYETRREPVCGLTEGESTEEVSSPSQDEIHVHTDACYETRLICELPEHTHSLSCYSDPDADRETSEVWERSVAGVTLTGVWADDVIAIAETQLGYQESERNYTVDEDGTIRGYTRYGAWYNDPYGDWSALFVSFCLHYAKVPEDVIPIESSAQAWADRFSGSLYHRFSESTPQKGDIILFDENGDGLADQAGLLAKIREDGTGLSVIAGDRNNRVCTVSCHSGDSDLAGFLSLPGEDQTSDGEEESKALSPLKDDSAYISGLYFEEISVESESENTGNTQVRNGDRLSLRFTAQTDTYTENAFSQGRIRLEFVLPLPQEAASFDLSAMQWLEDGSGGQPSVSLQTRTVNGQETDCQVLTGFCLLSSREETPAIPGSITETVVIRLEDAPLKESFALQLNAAMEHNTWDGVCGEHQISEKQTLVSEAFTVVSSLTEEELLEIYERFLEEVQALESLGALNEAEADTARDLLERLSTAHEAGELSDENYIDLYERVSALLTGEYNAVAEPAVGTNHLLLKDSGWFEAYSTAAAGAYSTWNLMRSGSLGMKQSPVQTLSLSEAPSQAAASDQQVTDRGGANTAQDGSVCVSKTIAGTELENVFDITLEVQTSRKISEIIENPDMAVVIVMDISNTMNSNFGGVTRYAAAMDAAEQFLDQFVASNPLGISKVGYVAFNTDAHQIFSLQPCSTQAQANELKNTMRSQTGAIINAAGYSDDHKRFTNVEAGLAMASDMLNGVSNRNKFIIFLSDGFPTTYISSGYTGYDPYDSSGLFHDRVLNKPCLYGTSYSDEAAIRARKKAGVIKTGGTTIFSIGVDVQGQTIQTYITQSENADGFSVVDRTGTTYEIGGADDISAYKNWLRDSIGSGYYYDSTDSAGLKSAYDQIFQEIRQKIEAGTEADWVASDPLPTVSGSAEHVEFIGLYDQTPQLAGTSLSGSNTEGGENTASFDPGTSSISWDLKKSGYQTESSGSTTVYTYRLVYRVRLKNESGSFMEDTVYPTNDTTTLQYRSIQNVNGSLTISDPKTIEFPIPSVHGYLCELSFRKTDTQGQALAGAVFTLSHDLVNCHICRGDETSVELSDLTASSGADGTVTFTGIPSGHRYILKETTVPEGYAASGNSYQVQTSYDTLSVSVTAADGEARDWTGTIENRCYYELPSTGGAGVLPFRAAGLLLCAAALVLLVCRKRKSGM